MPSGPVRIAIETDYPFADTFTITVAPERPSIFALLIRVPSWAERAEIRVDGDRIPAEPGTYARIEREWREGDRVILSVPMAPRLVHAARTNVQESVAPDGESVAQEVMNSKWVAVARGPLAYATGLIDGFRVGETIPLDGLLLNPVGERVELQARDRPAIPLEPYYRAGGRHHGAWRLTWLDVAPEAVGA